MASAPSEEVVRGIRLAADDAERACLSVGRLGDPHPVADMRDQVRRGIHQWDKGTARQAKAVADEVTIDLVAEELEEDSVQHVNAVDLSDQKITDQKRVVA